MSHIFSIIILIGLEPTQLRSWLRSQLQLLPKWKKWKKKQKTRSSASSRPELKLLGEKLISAPIFSAVGVIIWLQYLLVSQQYNGWLMLSLSFLLPRRLIRKFTIKITDKFSKHSPWPRNFVFFFRVAEPSFRKLTVFCFPNFIYVRNGTFPYVIFP